jgi:hypothetical protein
MPCRRSEASRGWHDHRPRRAPALPAILDGLLSNGAHWESPLLRLGSNTRPAPVGGFEMYELTWPRAHNPKLNGESEVKWRELRCEPRAGPLSQPGHQGLQVQASPLAATGGSSCKRAQPARNGKRRHRCLLNEFCPHRRQRGYSRLHV